MTTGRKLAIMGVLVAGVTAYLAYRGAAASWQYYLTADECRAEGTSLLGRRLRVSGRIAEGTLTVDSSRTAASFSLAGEQGSLKVQCRGRLPDGLVEGTPVLVEGQMVDEGLLQGDKVLTRCASKYQSRAAIPSSAEAIKDTQEVGP